MEEPLFSIHYTLKLNPAKNRITIDLHRDDFKAPLGYFSASKQIKWLQVAHEYLFDKEDLKSIHRTYRAVGTEPKPVGSLELGLFPDGASVLVKYHGDTWAQWNPEKGLRFQPGCPSWLKKDRKHVVFACTEVPVGRGLGVFSGILE